jgi:uncharacterized protein (TIGR03437 family)
MPQELVTRQTNGISMGADGNIWMFLKNGTDGITSGTGNLYRWDGESSASFVFSVNGFMATTQGVAYNSTAYSESTVPSPQGKDNLMGYQNQVTYSNLGILQFTDGVVKTYCLTYTIDGGKGTMPQHLNRGPFPNFDGTYSLASTTITTVGNVNSVSSSIFELGKVNSATAVCDLRTVVTVDKDVVQAVKQQNGKYLVNQVVVPGGESWLTRVGLLGTDGSYTDLVSTTNNSFPAARCCYMSQDWGAPNAIVAYFGADNKSHGLSYVNGALSEVFNSGVSGQLTIDIWTNDFKGKTAVFGGSNRFTGFAGPDLLVAVDINTKKSTLVGAYNGLINGTVGYSMMQGDSTLDSDGTVYFVGYLPSDKTNHFFKAVIFWASPTFTKAEAEQPTITLGSSSQLTWCATNATTVSITGLGADAGTVIVPICGSIIVSPTTTWTYALTAIGPLGSAHATVTVTVVPNPPQIQAMTVIFGGTTSMKAAPGQIITIWGSLCGNVPADTQWVPLQTAVAGCSVKFADVQGQNVTLGSLYYVSAGQINVQVPDGLALGTAQMAVTFNGLSSAPQFFEVVSTNPDYVVETVGTQAYLKGVHLNGSYTTASNPAVGGETILVFLSGLGPGTKIAISVNGIPATVYYAGPQGDYPGLDQINVQVPANVKYGTQYMVTATATDGTQKVDTLSTEPAK